MYIMLCHHKRDRMQLIFNHYLTCILYNLLFVFAFFVLFLPLFFLFQCGNYYTCVILHFRSVPLFLNPSLIQYLCFLTTLDHYSRIEFNTITISQRSILSPLTSLFISFPF